VEMAETVILVITEIAEMVNVWNEVRIGKKKDILEHIVEIGLQ